jgi:hypothetical protein
VSNGQIWLFWFAGMTPWECHLKQVWPQVYNSSYQPGPKSDILFNLLYQKGIYPHMRVFELQYQKKYQSLDDAVSDMRRQMGNPDDCDTLIRQYLSDKVVHEGGSVVDYGSTTRVCIWWDTNQFPKR